MNRAHWSRPALSLVIALSHWSGVSHGQSALEAKPIAVLPALQCPADDTVQQLMAQIQVDRGEVAAKQKRTSQEIAQVIAACGDPCRKDALVSVIQRNALPAGLMTALLAKAIYDVRFYSKTQLSRAHFAREVERMGAKGDEVEVKDHSGEGKNVVQKIKYQNGDSSLRARARNRAVLPRVVLGAQLATVMSVLIMGASELNSEREHFFEKHYWTEIAGKEGKTFIFDTADSAQARYFDANTKSNERIKITPQDMLLAYREIRDRVFKSVENLNSSNRLDQTPQANPVAATIEKVQALYRKQAALASFGETLMRAGTNVKNICTQLTKMATPLPIANPHAARQAQALE